MALSPDYVVQGLVRRGIPRNAALGFAGNFVAESNLDPGINEIKPIVPGSRGGFGLAQWTGPRRKQLEAFAGTRGKSVADPEVQMDFLAWELQNTERGAAKSIFAAADPTEAARLVSEKFLRPGIPNMGKRLSATAEIAGGTFQGGGGDVSLMGQQGQDDLSDLDAFMGIAPPAPAAEPEQPAFSLPPSTLAQDYAAGGVEPVDFDLADLDAFMGISPAPMQSGVDAMTGQPMAVTPPRAEVGSFATPQQPSNIRGELSAPGFGAAGQFAQASQQSPGAYLPNIALSALSGLSGAIGYGIGGAADLAVNTGLMNKGTAQRLARDVMAMPEAFAGSPSAMQNLPTQVSGRAGPVATAARIEPPVTRPVPAPTMQDVQSLLVQAQGRGKTSRQAIGELAKQAKINPETAAAAERLGIDLPIDVFSDSIAVREAAGAIRGIKTGEAAADFFQSVEGAQGRASSIMSELDGGTSLAVVSENVLQSLRGTQATLKSSATDIYQSIDAKIPKATPIQASRTAAVLSETMSDLGGMSRMTSQEQTLVKALTNPDEPLTYAGLVRLKQDIGKALERGQGPYADVNQAMLKRLYGGLSDDQIAAVEAVGGADLRKGLEVANNLTAQRKDLEKSIVNAFGKDLEGSIATKLTAAVNAGTKGDVSGLNRLLGVIPPELQKEAVASAIGEIAKTKTGSAPGQFSFEGFAKTYQGLRGNPPVYKRVVDVLGKDGHAIMEDLYRVSSAVAKAKAAIPMTGKANQITQSGPLAAEGLIARIMNTTAGKTAVRAGTTGAFGIAGGVPGAIAADAVGAALTKGRPDRIQAAGKLLSSEQFKRLAIEAATMPEASPATRRAVLNSPAFRQFAKVAGIDDPKVWLDAALLGTIATSQQGAEQ